MLLGRYNSFFILEDTKEISVATKKKGIGRLPKKGIVTVNMIVLCG